MMPPAPRTSPDAAAATRLRRLERPERLVAREPVAPALRLADPHEQARPPVALVGGGPHHASSRRSSASAARHAVAPPRVHVVARRRALRASSSPARRRCCSRRCPRDSRRTPRRPPRPRRARPRPRAVGSGAGRRRRARSRWGRRGRCPTSRRGRRRSRRRRPTTAGARALDDARAAKATPSRPQPRAWRLTPRRRHAIATTAAARAVVEQRAGLHRERYERGNGKRSRIPTFLRPPGMATPLAWLG